MRKKIVSLSLLITFLCSAVAFAEKPPCTITKYRDKWRLFGYDKVDQLTVNDNGECTIKLECMGGGTTRCKPVGVEIYPNYEDNMGKPMTSEDEDNIDKMVGGLIDDGEVSGKFVYGNMALVSWQYDPASENVLINIYNREKAKKSFNIAF